MGDWATSMVSILPKGNGGGGKENLLVRESLREERKGHHCGPLGALEKKGKHRGES